MININNLVSMSEVNQNFTSVAKKVRDNGEVVVLKNNKPLFLISSIDDYMEISDGEKLEVAARRILKKYHKAFLRLAG